MRNVFGGGQKHARSKALIEVRQLYLDLVEAALTGSIYDDPAISPWSDGYDADARIAGRDWPMYAQTMIGVARMRNLRTLLIEVIEQGVPGDFIEAGVWRGGACIYARGIMKSYGAGDRRVWVADSFAGRPSDQYPADAGDPHHTFSELIVPLEEVRKNFERYGLLDGQVDFLKGWFKDTLPSAPIEKLAILRLDGDMYQSTMDTLDALYGKLVEGGFIIVDDFALEACRKAVLDFRARHAIDSPIEDIDGAGVFWRKT
jgi:O-methyltransferase/8-demethyl-8-(2,3-dimethoxy-alpha-L-rhamnosyl)tetracenomycin-C 4'-O-methyltransferase